MTNRTLLAIFRCAVLLIPLVAAFAHAGTISVPGDSPSIKGAMFKARPGDIILISCGTYFESDILVKPGVSLWSGTLQPDCVTIDAQSKGRCLIIVEADSTTSVVGITFRGGQASADNLSRGGAISCRDAAPRFTRCIFANNRADAGGAVAADGDRGPLFDDCTFTNNTANTGGAIAWRANTGKIARCAFVDNSAQFSGGAITSGRGQIIIVQSIFSHNSAGNSGGAISLSTSQAHFAKSIFVGNQGGLSGGAISSTQSTLILRQCTLHGNDADGQGTVLSSSETHPVFEACLITGSANPLFSATTSEFTISSSNILPLQEEDWPTLIANWFGIAGNLSVDPLYCAPESGDLHLTSGSPNLKARPGEQIGALGQGCGVQFP